MLTVAAHTVTATDRSVKLNYVLRPCFLVQTVNVLSYHGAQLTLFFKTGKKFVRKIRLGVGIKHIFSVKFKKSLGLVDKTFTAEKIFRSAAVGIKPRAASEVGYSTVCGNSRASEEHHPFALLKITAELLYFV
jgi:hypothetical protein